MITINGIFGHKYAVPTSDDKGVNHVKVTKKDGVVFYVPVADVERLHKALSVIDAAQAANDDLERLKSGT